MLVSKLFGDDEELKEDSSVAIQSLTEDQAGDASTASHGCQDESQ